MFSPQKQTEQELMAVKDRPALGGRCRRFGRAQSLSAATGRTHTGLHVAKPTTPGSGETRLPVLPTM